MRGKKAKQLRSIAGYAAKRGVPELAYEAVQHRPKLVKLGRLNEDGTEKMGYITTSTVIMGECQRNIYQQMKRGVLNGN